MTVQIGFPDNPDFRAAFLRKADVIAKAATEAMRKAGVVAKQKVAADIAAAGFSSRWQQAVTTRAYPQTGASIAAALFIAHRIPYAGIFEEGGQINGRPYLWLPLPSASQFGAVQRVTPSAVASRGVRLVSINRAGRFPLLAVERVGPFGRKYAEPVFIGVPSVDIRRRFHFQQAVEQTAARVPDLYAAALKDE